MMNDGNDNDDDDMRLLLTFSCSEIYEGDGHGSGEVVGTETCAVQPTLT